MPSFDLTIDSRLSGPGEDPLEIAGEDVSLAGGDFSENANRDISTVSGRACAQQSAIRETIANPGSFPRRPQWGAGVMGLLFKGNSVTTRDRIQSRTRARLLVNPRITKLHEVEVTSQDDGTRVFIRADAVGGRLEISTVIKPPGVS